VRRRHGGEPEDADDVALILERRRADLDSDTPPVLVEQRDREICSVGTEELPREQLARPRRVLGSDDAREVAADSVADEVACCGVEPADPAPTIEAVARDAHRSSAGHRSREAASSFPESADPCLPARRVNVVAARIVPRPAHVDTS
jgi:hypothetical protein